MGNTKTSDTKSPPNIFRQPEIINLYFANGTADYSEIICVLSNGYFALQYAFLFSLLAFTSKETKMSQTKTPIQIDAKDLPLRCQGAQTQGWNGHPSVGLAIQANGTATCPYCGTVYQVNGKIQSHH